MRTVRPEGLSPRLEIDHICDLRKSVSKLVYPVSGPDALMYEVGAGLL
jgi:hypothetical protein